MNCKEGNKEIIHQINYLLDSIDNQSYTKSLDIFNGSSIGQHFRHILDFYLCLIKGTEDQTIDYAKRDRNALAETSVLYVREAFAQIAADIDHLSEEKKVEVWGDFSKHQDHARPLVQSSIGRELMFAHDHAIHHLAIIKIGIRQALPELYIDDTLGVAPSTVKYRSNTQVTSVNSH